MDERSVSGWHRDRDASANHSSLTWRDGDISGRDQIGTGITGVGVTG
jgi:hypothetical protein